MQIQYSISAEDYLQYLLFVASKSTVVRKKRFRNRFLITAMYLMGGGLFAINAQYYAAGIFALIALLWVFIYPLWEAKRYKSSYLAYIHKNFQGKMDKIGTLHFREHSVEASGGGTELKVDTKDFVEFSEISDAIYLKMKGGQSFVLPKNKIATIQTFLPWLRDYAKRKNIPYHSLPTWRWA